MSVNLTENSFDAFVQHWAEARLDTPLHVIGRFDDAARQLITAGALIQAAYVAAFGFGTLKAVVPNWGVVLLFAPLILMIVCAATVICAMPKHLEAHPTFKLLQLKQMGSSKYEATLDCEMKAWCRDMEALAKWKRGWLHAANASFVCASAITLGTLGWFVMTRVSAG